MISLFTTTVTALKCPCKLKPLHPTCTLMNTLHPVQDHFDIIEWGLYTDLSLFVQLNDPEVNKTTVLKDQAAFLQNLCAFDLKLNIVDNGAIIRRHLGFPWSQAPLGQSLGRCRAGGVGEGE